MSDCYKIRPYVAYNDQNDPLAINQQNYDREYPASSSSHLKDHQKLYKIRKDYIKKVQIIEEEHKKEVNGLRQDFQRQQKEMKESHARQITEKDSYIKILQSLVKKQENAQKNTHGVAEIDDFKYVYTEQYSKNYVPFFEDIQSQIDFKIEHSNHNKKYGLSRNRQTQRYRNDSGHLTQKNSMVKSVKSSSHHKLMPKSKPEGGALHEISSFKLLSQTHKIKKHSFAN